MRLLNLMGFCCSIHNFILLISDDSEFIDSLDDCESEFVDSDSILDVCGSDIVDSDSLVSVIFITQ